jgi:hypothetical protein
MSSSSTRLPTPEGPGVGHWVAEEILAALREFLAPYRDGGAAAHETHERSART